MTGRLIGIARHRTSKSPTEKLESVEVTREDGVDGDRYGAIGPRHGDVDQVVILLAERWTDVEAEFGQSVDWTLRRGNLLIEGIDLPKSAGSVLRIGRDLRLETTEECDPCAIMDRQLKGLKAALRPDWRGGYRCRVIESGAIAIGDEVKVIS